MNDVHRGLQKQLENLQNRPVAGWKVGLTSGRARDSMGKGFRPFGYILEERCLQTGATIELRDVGDVGVENELCFLFGTDLPKNATRQEVLQAIEGVSAAFEINETRLDASASMMDRLADDLSQWGIVVGESKSLDWQTFAFEEVEVNLACDGRLVETVAALNHIDDHFDSLVALSATLGQFDRQILAGNRIITGSYTRQRVSKAGDWKGDFGSIIGTVEVAFK